MQKVIDGVRLAYDDAGSGDALVLLHGFALDRTIWDAQFVALAGHRRVLRLDLRGSGESACGEGPALMETLAGDVFGLLDALDIERAVVAGHGMGAYVALAFFRMYAERVAGLALIAGGVSADPADRWPERDAQLAALETRGIDALLETYLPRALGSAAAGNRDLRERVRAIVGRQQAAGAAAQLAGIKQRVGSEDLLEDIAVPAAIVAGDADPWISIDALTQTATAMADCRLVRFAGVGHLPMLETPAATTDALAALMLRCAFNPTTDPHTARATRA
jgi:pimeloyl-ACP methyl ester carboxylesterase